MSSVIRAVELKNGKRLMLMIRDDGLVYQVDILSNGQLQETHKKP